MEKNCDGYLIIFLGFKEECILRATVIQEKSTSQRRTQAPSKSLKKPILRKKKMTVTKRE